ncbi:MAG: AAA-like domain-containing protein [Anaerolineae bacterium]|nr:AAA-like domain-containing protein [Anaerolineae bacterium]
MNVYENPFETTGFLDPDNPNYSSLYVSRNGLEANILARLRRADRPHGAYIYGPRQIGKTSLMYHLGFNLKNNAWKYVYVTLNTLSKDNQQEWCQNLWMRFANQLKISIVKADLPQNISDFHTAIMELPKHVDALRILIIFEEIETIKPLNLEDDLWIQFLVMIRSLDQERNYAGAKKLGFVLAGHENPYILMDTMPTEWKLKVSPLLNTLQPFHLVDFDLDGVKQHSTFFGTFLGVTLTDEVVGRIFAWTSGHPYLTQKVFSNLYESVSKQLPNITIDGIVKNILNDPAEPHLAQHLANKIKSFTDKSRTILLKSLSPQPPFWSLSDVEQQRLHTLGLIKKRDPNYVIIRNSIYAAFIQNSISFSREQITPALIYKGLNIPSIHQQVLRLVSQSVGIGLLAWVVLQTFILRNNLLLPLSILFSYLIIYFIIWFRSILSQRQSMTINLQENNPFVPRVFLEFDTVIRPDQNWTVTIRGTEENPYQTIELHGQPMKEINWINSYCEVNLSNQNSFITARLTKPTRWRYILLPWPDMWVIPLEIRWLGHFLKAEISVIADSPKTIPRILIGPINWFVTLIGKKLEGT